MNTGMKKQLDVICSFVVLYVVFVATAVIIYVVDPLRNALAGMFF